MKIPKHKRFLFKLAGNNFARVGVVHIQDINKHLDECFKPTEILKYENSEEAFAATFRHGSEFIKWIDDKWIAD